ncbi:MAG: hypothetical protein JO179_06175 [Solirubrobacterales bacterium]|nr:hypothetical protein [Solirubrobacterales bacterium]
MQDRGYEVDAIRIPFDPDPATLWMQLLAFRLTDVSDVGELLVATGTPSHLLRHPRKVLWLIEHYPWFDDQDDALESMRTADRQACEEATALFAASSALCDRVARSSGRSVKALSPPEQGSWDPVIAALTGSNSRGTSR